MQTYSHLVENIQTVLLENRQKVLRTINQTVVITYWEIGRYIVEFEQNGQERAKYGTNLLKNLSSDLSNQFGKGFSYRNLRLFRQLFLTFPIWQSLIAKLENKENLSKYEAALLESSWTHLVRLLSVKNDLERQFYIIESVENNWSVRELNRQIESALFERLIISKEGGNIQELAIKGHNLLEPRDVLKDPYILEFLGLDESNIYSESDLETAIIDHIEQFLLELGKGFSFVARQFRISSGAQHFKIDLVFYNRLLRCHVLIDLKIGTLRHQDIGQMQMYVNYFDRELKTDYENPTIGIILCKEKDDFVVEYSLPLDNNQIFSTEYQLYLPDKAQLKGILSKYL